MKEKLNDCILFWDEIWQTKYGELKCLGSATKNNDLGEHLLLDEDQFRKKSI